MDLYKSIVEKSVTRNVLALQDSLQQLAIAKKELYYDANRDELNRKAYYKNIHPDTLDDKKMYQQLSEHLKKTHTRQLSYDEARRAYLYSRVDLQPNKMLKSIYSGEEFSPEKIIEADFKIKEEIIKRAGEQFSRMRNMNEVTFMNHLHFLEANATYNAEHSVPQSWFAKRDPMKADLHHLFTCETTCNEYRANIPFFDFPDSSKVSRPGCGKIEGNRFEPAQGHGAVARATLYFLIRYPKEINNNLKEYTAAGIQILLKWHKEVTASPYELHRNAEIFAVQGNRNPLIDHPEWGTKINFSLGLGN